MNSNEIHSFEQKLLELQQEELMQRAVSAKETFDVITQLKASLKNTLKESKSSQNMVKWMYGVTFFMGVIILGFSIYFAILGKDFLAIAFGSIGLLDIIAHLIAKPPVQLQDARSNYTQLTVGVLTWFNDLIDKSTFIVNMQTQAQKLFENEPDLDKASALFNTYMEKAIEISNLQLANSITMLETIEKVAEPSTKGVLQEAVAKAKEIQKEA